MKVYLVIRSAPPVVRWLAVAFLLLALLPVTAAPLPGQIIVNPETASWLAYNRDSDGNGSLDSFFLCGPGDPEGFLYRGTRNADGTRDGDQLDLIDRLSGTGANSIYLMAIRSNLFGGDGAEDESPFNDPSDPASGVNTATLDQWETWFAEMDARGILIFFFLYDDNIEVSLTLGWPLDPGGALHPDERSFVQTLVNRFKHHRNLIWVVMEEVEEMGDDYLPHALRLAQVIKQTDDHDHVVAVHRRSGLDFSEFADDPNIDQHAIQYNRDSAADLHAGMVDAWTRADGRYNLNMTEASGHGVGTVARQKAWAIALGGAYVMALGWDIADTPIETLEDCGRLVSFMEATDLTSMAPHDELRFGGTEYVLADPGESYVLYSSSVAANGDVGLREMNAGTYDFQWFDPVTGESVTEIGIPVTPGDHTWTKPGGIGDELALRVSRSTAASTPPEAPQNLRVITRY